MSLQVIKSINGKDEYVLLPVDIYNRLKPQIDSALAKQYEVFELTDYITNPVALMRIKANLTQKNLADLLGVSQAYISKIESSNDVSIKVINKVKHVLSTK